MSVDTSIYNSLMRPPKSVAEYDAEALSNQQNRLAVQSGQQKLDEYTRSVSDGNKLRQVVSGFGADKGANYNALLGGGHLKEAEAYAKQNADITKTGAETQHLLGQTQKDQFGVIVQANGLVGSAAGAIMQNPDPAHAAQVVAGLKTTLGPELSARLGLDTLQIPQDPVALKAWATDHYTQSIDTDKQLADARAKSEGDANRKAQRDNSIRSDETQRRGQNMADQRAKDALEAGKSQIVQSDNGPVLVNTKTGAGKQVLGPDGQPLAGVTKPLNDSQSKALLFGTRMQEAHKVLGQLATEGTTNSVPGSRAPGIGGIINALSPENSQMLDQAKRDFMTALLRRESGAAISSGEFDTADKQYFPQVGESAKVSAQKARNRELAINGVLVEVPEKQRASITPKAATGAPATAVRVTDKASYDKVPSGAEYITPDGHTRRKP